MKFILELVKGARKSIPNPISDSTTNDVFHAFFEMLGDFWEDITKTTTT